MVRLPVGCITHGKDLFVLCCCTCAATDFGKGSKDDSRLAMFGPHKHHNPPVNNKFCSFEILSHTAFELGRKIQKIVSNIQYKYAGMQVCNKVKVRVLFSYKTVIL